MARTKERLSLEDALPAGRKPTLKTIAQMCGLAVPTVSRALNDAPDIGQDTKVMVRRIADEIGYIPNRAGVRLRTGRTNVISLVMSTDHDNNTAQLISAVASGLQGTRYHLNVTPYAPGDDFLKPVRYIADTGSADALILNQIEPEDPRIAFLMEKKIPFATHGRTVWSDQHPYYDYDNETFGRMAMDLLAERGRKKVAVSAPPMAQNYGQHLVKGLSVTAAQQAMEISLIKGVTSDEPLIRQMEAVKAKLGAGHGFDAVIAASTDGALAAVAAIEALGMTVGKDIDVVSKDAGRFLNTFRKDILTLPELVGTAGDFLARAVLQAIQHPELPPMQYLEVPKQHI